jgi:hypothetical protein
MDIPKNIELNSVLENTLITARENLISPETNQYFLQSITNNKDNLKDFEFQIPINIGHTLGFKLNQNYLPNYKTTISLANTLTDFFSGEGFEHVFRFWVNKVQDSGSYEIESRKPVYRGLAIAIQKFPMFEDVKVYDIKGNGEGSFIYRGSETENL